MKSLIFLVALLITVFSTYSQSMDGRQYEKAILFLKNQSSLNVKKLNIKGTDLFFINNTNREQQLKLDGVNTIKARKGNYFLEGATYTGIVCLGAAIVASSRKDTTKPTTGEFAGFVAGGAVLGGLVGLLFPKWKEVYSKGDFLGQRAPLYLKFGSPDNQLAIKITIAL